jgi:predicted nucleic acid-binding protein
VLRNPKTPPERRDRVAGMAAPYLHPKLQVVDSTVRAAVVDVTGLTVEQRRQRARQAILEAFAERPMRLIEGEVVEVEPAEMLATERKDKSST